MDTLDKTDKTPDGAASALRTRYLAAQLKGDRREALRLISDEAGGLGSGEIQLEVIQEAQREIGRLWEENRITIAQEHMATAISQLALAQVYRDAKSEPSNGKLVLVACVQGEQHAFPAQLVADRLELSGFNVRFLGADVPTSGLLEMIEKLEPDLLALSCSMVFHVPSLRDAVKRVRALPGPRLPLLIGGNAILASNFSDEVDGIGRDANEMISLTRKLLGMDP